MFILAENLFFMPKRWNGAFLCAFKSVHQYQWFDMKSVAMGGGAYSLVHNLEWWIEGQTERHTDDDNTLWPGMAKG